MRTQPGAFVPLCSHGSGCSATTSLVKPPTEREGELIIALSISLTLRGKASRWLIWRRSRLPDSSAPPSGLSGVRSAAACRQGRKSEVCAAAAQFRHTRTHVHERHERGRAVWAWNVSVQLFAAAVCKTQGVLEERHRAKLTLPINGFWQWCVYHFKKKRAAQ